MRKIFIASLLAVCCACTIFGLSACEFISALIVTKNLEYTLSDDGTYYIVSGLGDCTDSDIEILSTYNDLPVTEIAENAFGSEYKNNTTIQSVIIPDSITTIGDKAFYNCNSLNSITIGSGVTSIGYYVFNKTPYYNTSSNWVDDVLYIGNCLIVAKNTVSESYSVKDGTTVIADFAFSLYGESQLTDVTIPDSVITIGYGAFNTCTSLINITVSSGNKTFKAIDGDLYSYNGKTLIQYAIGKTNGSFTISADVTAIYDYAFCECPYIQSVTIPISVTSIGYGAFLGCDSLSTMVIPNSVTTIGNGIFSQCPLLKSITLSDNITCIGRAMFEGCDSLTSINIPASVTYIGDYAFQYCISLTSVTIPKGVTSVGYKSFYECTALQSVTFENANGWYVTYSKDDTNGSGIELTNASDNVTYLTDTYVYAYLYRSEN